jgi:hypothetical protein
MHELSHPLSRRQFARLLGGGSLALVAGGLLSAQSASAGIGWCRVDPIVRLGGTRVQFWVSVPEENVPAVNGPIACRVLAPANVARVLEFTDAGFNGHGEVVVFRDGGHAAEAGRPFPVSIWVEVPHAERSNKFPIVVDIVPENGAAVRATGNAGSTTIKLTIAPTG